MLATQETSREAMGSVGASGVAAKAESLDKALRRDRDCQRAPWPPGVAPGEHCMLPSVVQGAASVARRFSCILYLLKMA